ncbi:hypothetical protein Bbelb_064500 [Branchiostoma belcheri]|nr:hypothetical protein Bbelb_064500 [Branchiostoma belcheri]
MGKRIKNGKPAFRNNTATEGQEMTSEGRPLHHRGNWDKMAQECKMRHKQRTTREKGVSHEKELSHGGSLGIGPSIINSFPGQSASPSMISFPGSSMSVVPYCDLGVVLHKSLQRLREFLKALRKVRHVRWNMETPDIWGTLDERPVCFLVATHWVYT